MTDGRSIDRGDDATLLDAADFAEQRGSAALAVK